MTYIDVESLWDNASFEQIISIGIDSRNPAPSRTLRESSAALELERRAETSKATGVGEARGSENLHVVSVLHTSLPHFPGGYSSRAHGLLKALASRGINVAAVTRPGFYESMGKENQGRRESLDEVFDTVRYVHLPTDVRREAGEYQYMLASIGEFKNVFREFRPNIVHLRSTYLIALPAMIAAHELGIPVLYEVSGLWELVYAGRGQTGEAARTEWMENIVVRNADRVLTMNSSMGRELSSRIPGGIEFGELPNAVDPKRFSSISPLSEARIKYDLGYVGSLLDYEGLDILVGAIATLRDRGTRVTAKIVGGGAELRSIKQLILSNRLEDQVNLVGPVSAEMAVSQFEDVRIVVLPRKSTPATENVTPLKPFEAMAAGRPLIVSDVKALSEVSAEGRYAELFTQGSVTDLASKIVALVSNEAFQRALVQRSHELIQNKYNWDNIAQTMESELRSHAKRTLRVPASRLIPKVGI